MASIANLNPNTAALAPVNIHAHGHRRGLHRDSADSSSDTAAQVPAGTVQNLFGSLLSSLEQVIGLQSAATTPAATTAASSTTGGATAASPNAAAAASIATTTQSPSSLLHNYLNNLRTLQVNDSLPAKLAGTNLNVRV